MRNRERDAAPFSQFQRGHLDADGLDLRHLADGDDPAQGGHLDGGRTSAILKPVGELGRTRRHTVVRVEGEGVTTKPDGTAGTGAQPEDADHADAEAEGQSDEEPDPDRDPVPDEDERSREQDERDDDERNRGEPATLHAGQST